MQTTYVMIKPDGVQRGLIGEIIGRFERKGLQLVGMKSIIPSERLLENTTQFTRETVFPWPNQVRYIWTSCMYGLERRRGNKVART